MNLKKNGKLFTSIFVGTGLSSYKKKNLPGRGLTEVEKHWYRCLRLATLSAVRQYPATVCLYATSLVVSPTSSPLAIPTVGSPAWNLTISWFLIDMNLHYHGNWRKNFSIINKEEIMGDILLFASLNQPKKVDVLLQLWDKTFHTVLTEGKETWREGLLEQGICQYVSNVTLLISVPVIFVCIIYYAPSIHNLHQTRCNNYS